MIILTLIVNYFVTLLVTIPVIYYAYVLSKRFRLKYLQTLFHYLLCSGISSFLLFLTPDMFNLTHNMPLQREGSDILGLTTLISMPTIILYLYLFARFLFQLNRREPGRLFHVVFCTLSAAMAVNYLIGMILSFTTNSGEFLNAIYQGPVRQGSVIYRFAVIGYALFLASSIADPSQRRLNLRIGWLYLAGFVVHYSLRYAPVTPIVFYGRPILFIALNIPPLLLLSSYLKRYIPRELAVDYSASQLHQICAQHGLSPREEEICLLLVNGWSNREIEKKLFISIGTVKNHAYSIYQKFKVKNRVKLLFAINELNKPE
jgi:DNA-binding CsgD family transcriptional regulator